MTHLDTPVNIMEPALGDALSEIFVSKASANTPRECVNEAILWLRDKKCLSLIVPVALGGHGASIQQACNLIARVSAVSGSLGLIYAMHLSQVQSLVNHYDGNEYLESYIRELCEAQLLIASATSEKGNGGDILTSSCRIMKSDSGLQLHKEVPNISYLDLADAILVTALHHENNDKQVLALARQSTSNMVGGFEGSFIGMKGIFNSSYIIDAKFPEKAIFSEIFSTIARSTMTPATQIMWAAVWSGLAMSAINKARTFVRKELKHSKQTQKDMAVVVSELANKQFTLNSLINASVSEFDKLGAGEIDLQAAARMNRLKLVASKIVNEICIDALGVVGLRGYSENGPYSLASEIGDALSAPLMVSNYRLLANNAAIENFVDESLSLD
jgi:acyl-CoA dehydrogenase